MSRFESVAAVRAKLALAMIATAGAQAIARPAAIEVPGVITHYRSFGSKRPLEPAPVPSRESDESPAETARLRDPLTGAMVGQFGSAYLTSSPLPVLDPALKDHDDPGWW